MGFKPLGDRIFVKYMEEVERDGRRVIHTGRS